MGSEESGSYKVLKGFVAVFIQINLFVDSIETQAVNDNERVREIIFRKVIVGKLELIDLFANDDTNSFIEGRNRILLP